MGLSTEQTFRAKIKVDSDGGASLKGIKDAAKGASASLAELSPVVTAANQALELGKKAWNAMSGAAKAAYGFTVEAAAASETSTNRLSIALQGAGGSAAGSLPQVIAFAHNLQTLSGVNEDVIKGLVATNVQFGLSTEWAEHTAKAALGLSKQLGIDLPEANARLQQSLIGQVDGLRKANSAVDKLTLSQDRAGDAILMIEGSTSKFINGDAKTFEGVLTRLSLGWEGLGKQVGAYIIKGAGLGDKLDPLQAALQKISRYLEDNRVAFENLGRVLAGEGTNAILKVVEFFTTLAPMIPDLTKSLVDFVKLGLIPTAQGFLTLVRSAALFTGNMDKYVAAQVAMDKLSSTLGGLDDKIKGFNKSGGIDWKAKLGTGEMAKQDALINGLLAKSPLGVKKKTDEAAAAPAAAPKTKVHLPLTREQAQQQLMMQRQLDDQRLTLELSYGNDLTAAYQTAYKKITEVEQDAAKLGYDVTRQTYDLRRALDKKYFHDLQVQRHQDAVYNAQMGGVALETARRQYILDLANQQDAFSKGRISYEDLMKARTESLRKLGEAQITNDTAVATAVGDSSRVAEEAYKKQLVDLDRLELSADDYADALERAQKVRDAAVSAGPINDVTAQLAPETQMPMLAAASKLLDAVQALIDFIPGLLDKVTGIFTSLRDLPLKIAEGFKNVFLAVRSFVDNIAKNLGKAIEQILTTVADVFEKLPDAFGRAVDQLPAIVGRLMEKLPMIAEHLVEGIITHVPKIAYALTVGLAKDSPAIGAAIVKGMVAAIPAIWHGIQDAFKDIGKMLLGKWKWPPIDATPIKKALDTLMGSSSALFKVEDFNNAVRGLDIGDRIAAAANSAATNIANLFGQLWKALVAAVKAAWQWVLDTVIMPIVTIVQRAFQWVVDHVLTPIAGVVAAAFQWVVDKIIAPLAGVVQTAFQWVVDHVLTPIYTVVTGAFQWVVANVVTPLATIGRVAFQWVADNVVTPLASIGVKGFQWVYDNVVAPLQKVVGSLTGFRMPTFSWPTLPTFTWPSYKTFSWPNFPTFTWPTISPPDLSIPRPGWLDGLATGGPVGPLAKLGGALNTAASHATVGNAKKALKNGHFATGGTVRGGVLYADTGAEVHGTDTVPAMLTAGEYVINRHSAQRIGYQNLDAMNRGLSRPGGGGAVVNVSLTVNTTQPIDGSFIRGKLVPVLMDAIKEASQNGRYVMSTKGLRNA